MFIPRLRTILLLLLLVGLSNWIDAQQSKSRSDEFSSIVNEIESKLQNDISNDTLGGSISIAIVHKNQIVWSKAFGYSDRETKSPADSSTIYRIASLTKSFTATALMQLVEKGLLKLNDPVELYLPEIRNLKGYSESHKITFFQLATHTAGLEREPRLDDGLKDNDQNWESKVLECIPATLIKTTPGKKYNYSNIGFAILGLALERASKKAYVDLVSENIFEPLQMHNSFFVLPTDKVRKLAKGISINASGIISQISSETAHGYGVPAGAIYSTANDLARFLMANMGFNAVCNADSRNLMQTGVKPPLTFFQNLGVSILSVFLHGNNKEIVRIALHSKYGMGLSVYKYKNINIIEHSGLVPGYSSQFSFDKNSEYGIVLLRNYREGKTNLDLFSMKILSELRKLRP